MICENCLHENICEKRACINCQLDYCDECGCHPYFGNPDVEGCFDFLSKKEFEKIKYSKWIEKTVPLDWGDDVFDTVYECFLCKTDSLSKSAHCPNCGATMINFK